MDLPEPEGTTIVMHSPSLIEIKVPEDGNLWLPE